MTYRDSVSHTYPISHTANAKGKAEMTKYDAATNLAMFLLETKGSVCGIWAGHMKAAQQRALFGRFIGKGQLVIDGARETITHTVKRCFGLDYEITFAKTWAGIEIA